MKCCPECGRLYQNDEFCSFCAPASPPAPAIEGKEETELAIATVYKVIEHFQTMRETDDECADTDTWSDKVLSYNEVEYQLYEILEKIDPTPKPSEEWFEERRKEILEKIKARDAAPIPAAGSEAEIPAHIQKYIWDKSTEYSKDKDSEYKEYAQNDFEEGAQWMYGSIEKASIAHTQIAAFEEGAEAEDHDNIWDAWEGWQKANKEMHGGAVPDLDAYLGENIRKNYGVIRMAAAERGAKWMRDALDKELKARKDGLLTARKKIVFLEEEAKERMKLQIQMEAQLATAQATIKESQQELTNATKLFKMWLFTLIDGRLPILKQQSEEFIKKHPEF